MDLSRFTISGYRGIWGDGITPAIAKKLVHAYAVWIKENGGTRVMLGRDGRVSGQELEAVVVETLVAHGLHVTTLGMTPTPTVMWLIRERKCDGGIMITASHNPIEYNGLKFFSNRGLFLVQDELELVKTCMGKRWPGDEDAKGSVTASPRLLSNYIAHIVKNVDRELIAVQDFTVVVDVINSVGAFATKILLEELGVKYVLINDTPDGNFAHPPEPLAENLTELGEVVKSENATVGFAQDPDADRLVVCDEKGTVVNEEYGLALAIESVLSQTSGDTAVNIATTRTIEDITRKYGGECVRTSVGETNVTEALLATEGIIGGEGSGGIIYPKINAARDSLVGIALILEYLARTKKPVSELVDALPKYVLKKTKYAYTEPFENIIEKFDALYTDGVRDTIDGIRYVFPDGAWLLVRSSNTEPIVRVFCEAKTNERVEELTDRIKNIF